MAVDAIKPIQGFEKGGVVIDSDPFSLGELEWSNCRNVRFDNRSVSKMSGETILRTLSNPNPVSLTPWQQPTITRNVYQTSTGRTFLDSGSGTDSEITKNVSATAEPLAPKNNHDTQYTGGLFNGGATYIVNDGTNIPQYINAAGSGIAAQELVDIPAWAYDSAIFTSVRPQVLRPYRNVLVAGNLRFTQTNNQIIYAPGTIRVSNLAARGVLPTWDPNLPGATTADEFDLATNEEVVDMLPFQDNLIIYCTNSIHSLRITGNSSLPVATNQLLSGRGLLGTNCAIEFYGRHFVVGNEDIYLYGGGASVNSIVDEKVRDYFYENLNMAAKKDTFVFENRLQDEIWVCYPKGTSTTANEALIWNYKYGTWTIRDLSNGVAGGTAAIIPTGESTYDPNSLRSVMLDRTNNQIRLLDEGTAFVDQPINAFIEKRGFDVDPANDKSQIQIRYVWLIIRGNGDVRVQFRSTEAPGRPVNFASNSDRYLETRTFSLDPDMGDYRLTPLSEGRYLNMRLGTNDITSSWSLVKYSLGIHATDNR